MVEAGLSGATPGQRADYSAVESHDNLGEVFWAGGAGSAGPRGGTELGIFWNQPEPVCLQPSELVAVGGRPHRVGPWEHEDESGFYTNCLDVCNEV